MSGSSHDAWMAARNIEDVIDNAEEIARAFLDADDGGDSSAEDQSVEGREHEAWNHMLGGMSDGRGGFIGIDDYNDTETTLLISEDHEAFTCIFDLSLEQLTTIRDGFNHRIRVLDRAQKGPGAE